VPHKIIVADASPTLQRIIQGAFPETEFRLFPVANGNDLMASVLDIRPDAILLNLSIDGRDGYDLARVLRNQAETRRTPLFLMKGAFDVLDAGRVAAIEHDGVFVKPFDSERLAADVRRAIEKRTTPTSLPEEPIWTESEAGEGAGEGPPKIAPVPDRPRAGRDAGGETAGGSFGRKGVSPPPSVVRDWVRAEICELERELEKRIRARVIAELKEASGGGGDSGKT
jgi:CheY-like chemotaxis protein